MYESAVFWLLATQACLINVANGYGDFRISIPNGNIVPHPCKQNAIWKGVGHLKEKGGGNRNPFGKDFKDADKKWTKELCEKDSDGDGKTNGQELGDPDCVWYEGKAASLTTGLSHPGVCEPWTDIKCKDQLEWLTTECASKEFVCDSINDIGVQQQSIRFPPTPVPVKETTYMCMEFNVDTTGDFHLIATEPILNNTNVMHHAVVFGCGSDDHDIRDTPYECGMTASRECDSILSIWTLGSSGECFHEKIGFRIGINGYKRVALQFHWNNPTLRTDYVDQSGMLLHYTSNRHENDAGILTIGAENIIIPPRTLYTEETAICPGSCTSTFMKDKIYVVSAWNHMHYLGKSQKIEVFRNGTKIIELTNDKDYHYDSPVVHDKPTPVELLPGDTLTSTCVYNSEHTDTITTFGDATSMEMCYGFITYFPKDNVEEKFCTSWDSLAYCEIFAEETYKGCNVRKFTRLEDDDTFHFSNLTKLCNSACPSECVDTLDKLFEHPCMQGDLKPYCYKSWKYYEQGRQLLQLIDVCHPNGNEGFQMDKCILGMVMSITMLLFNF